MNRVKLYDADALWEMITNFEPMEMTFTINDADLDKLNDVIKDINVKECPYFDIADKYGNEARYYRENGWIPCSERLPESFQEVLVCGDNGNMDIIIGFTVDGIDDRWIWQMSPKLLFVKEIVAWQPLPERFRKEGGEE